MLLLYRGKLSFYFSVRMCRCLVCHWVCVCVCVSPVLSILSLPILFQFANVLGSCGFISDFTQDTISLFQRVYSILQGSTYHHLYFSHYTFSIRPVYFCTTCNLWCNALSHCHIGPQIGINMLWNHMKYTCINLFHFILRYQVYSCAFLVPFIYVCLQQIQSQIQ